jgi:hypothetical protein
MKREAKEDWGPTSYCEKLKRFAPVLKAMRGYDVIGPDGIVIGRIFKATTSPIWAPWMWTLLTGITRTERGTDMRQHSRPRCRHLLRAGRRDPCARPVLSPWGVA